MKVTFLGSGSAYRTPTAGGHWGGCDPNNPKNRRLCQSLFLENAYGKLVVDMGPDFREQSVKYGIDNPDAVFITHAHYDHYFGLPEAEVFSLKYEKSVPVYAHASTWADMMPAIHWLVGSHDPEYLPIIQRKEVEYGKKLDVGGFGLVPFEQGHGSINSTGFRIGDFAYSTDLNFLPEESWKVLMGIKTWVLECDSIEPSEQHNNLEQCLEWIEKLKPRQTYLTHIHPSLDHEVLEKMLPANVCVAYDGLIFDV